MTTQRLPVPGSDDGNWGSILNGFLEVSHNSDGTIQLAAITQAGAVTSSQIGGANGVAGLDSSSLVPAAQMRPFNFRGPIAASTAYNPWDVIIYLGDRLLITTAFTTGTGTPPTVSSANYIKLSSRDEWHAVDYGIAGDGTTDNGAALNSLISEVSTQGGGTIILPSGAIMTSIPIVMQSFVHLRGPAWGSTIKLLANSNCNVIQFYTSPDGVVSNAFFCGLWNIEVHGNAANQTAGDFHAGILCTPYPLSATATNDPEFDPTHLFCNVFVKYTTGDGIQINGRSGHRFMGVYSGEACGGSAFYSTNDTAYSDCHAAFAGLGGFYFPHSSNQVVGCKSYNNGKAAAWTSGQNWTARAGAVYNGSLYIAKSALTSDTVVPSTDTTNWQLARACPEWGHGFYIDGSNAAKEMALSGCDAQENAGSGFYLNATTACAIQGTVYQINTIGAGNTNAGSNPNLNAAVVLVNSTGCVVDVAYGDIGGAYKLRIVGSSLRNDVRLAGDNSGTNLSSDSLTLLRSGNKVVIDGVDFTSTLSAQNDVALTGTNIAVPYSTMIQATSGLQSYWKLAESTGTAMTDLQGVASGTYGGTYTLAQTGLLTLDPDTSVLFGGGYGSVSSVYGFAGTAAFSFECWLNNTVTSSDTGFRRIVSVESATNVGWSMSYQASTGSIVFTRGNGSGFDSFGAGPVNPVGATYHVVGTYDGTIMRVYVNGAQTAASASSRSLASQTTPLTIGSEAFAQGTLSFNGEIEKVAVYNVALSSATVAQHYEVGYAPQVIASNGQALVYNTSSNKWVNASIPSNASPAFTGTPTAPTASLLTNSTQIATTAYTDLAVAAGIATKPPAYYLNGGHTYRESVPRPISMADTAVLTSGVLYLVEVVLYTGDIVTNLSFRSHTTAAGTPTHWWFALYNSSYTLLSQTADQLTAGWGSFSTKTLVLASAQTISTSGVYYAGCMVAATTVPSLEAVTASTNINQAGGVSGQVQIAGTFGSGYTTTAPSSAATPTVVAPIAYAVTS